MPFDWGSFWTGTGAGVAQGGTSLGTALMEAPQKRAILKKTQQEIDKEEEDKKKRKKTARAEDYLAALMKPGAQVEEIKPRKVAMETAPGEIDVTEDVGPVLGREATQEDVRSAAYDVSPDTGTKYDITGIKKETAAERQRHNLASESAMADRAAKEMAFKTKKAKIDQAIDLLALKVNGYKADIYAGGQRARDAAAQLKSTADAMQAATMNRLISDATTQGATPQEIEDTKYKWDMIQTNLTDLMSVASQLAVERAGSAPTGSGGAFSATIERTPPDLNLDQAIAEIEGMAGRGAAPKGPGGQAPEKTPPSPPPFDPAEHVRTHGTKPLKSPDGTFWQVVNGQWQVKR